MEKSTTLLCYENIINIFLQGNILNIELMGSLTDKIMDDICIKLELFFEICKKKNKKYYQIFNLSKYDLLCTPNILYYINNIVALLKKNKEFMKEFLHGSIIITESKYSKSFVDLILVNYTPSRPFKFITTKDTIDFNFEE